MVGNLPRLVVAVLLCLAAALPPLGPGLAPADAAGAGADCSKGFARRREIAQGRFFDRRWELELFRDRKGRPCLVDGWSRYGAIFRFRVREHRPRLGVLHLAATTSPGPRPGVYVMEGYVDERVEELTFRVDGRTRAVRIVRSPRWTRLPKDHFVHFVSARRFDRDATGRLRAFGAAGRLLAERVLRRRQFFASAEPQ